VNSAPAPGISTSFDPGTTMRFLRLLPVALLAAFILVAAGCGGGSQSVPSDAVAKVGDDTITKAEFNFLINGAWRR
jgi:hypothetical protein